MIILEEMLVGVALHTFYQVRPSYQTLAVDNLPMKENRTLDK